MIWKSTSRLLNIRQLWHYIGMSLWNNIGVRDTSQFHFRRMADAHVEKSMLSILVSSPFIVENKVSVRKTTWHTSVHKIEGTEMVVHI